MTSDTNPAVEPARHTRWRALIFRGYDIAVDAVIIGVIPLMLIALGFAFVAAIITTIHLFPQLRPSTVDEFELRTLVERILDVVILIELFNTFMDYARTRRIRLSTLLDVTIVFSLREILIKLYAQNFSSRDLVALCIVVIALVIARSLTIKFSPVISKES
ncbi:MAG: phosphate-starvation-inducible PsiE family protein [Acidiphilium sp.]|nr:phosphate-starvation-inducible PsiE family protein [Acidiphilium sp.]MDD4935694.1 phosphate-starvation-inducible PsiE family protein [Acidiphilium sp.]